MRGDKKMEMGLTVFCNHLFQLKLITEVQKAFQCVSQESSINL